MKYLQETNNLIWTSSGFGNSIAFNLGNKVILIDSTFNWKIAQKWRKEVEKYFSQKVKLLFVTHHHADHCFGNQIFQDVPIVSSQGTRDRMEFSNREMWSNEEEMVEWKENGYGIDDLVITYPTYTFLSKMTIYGDDLFIEAKCVDGHTLGSSYLWEPVNKILIAGDLVFNKIYPYGGDSSTDLNVWIKAMSELISLKPNLILSGHGLTAELQDLIEIRNFLQATSSFIEKCLKDGLSPNQISQRTDFPDYYSDDYKERAKYSLQNWAMKAKQSL